MAAKRSRTGCQTCRRRKLKCDEVRPQCGQCTKSRRECVPSDGIAFRHEQNASMNGMDAQGGLENFFKYREAFTPEHLRNFVPIPKELQWHHIQDPYAEEQNPSEPPTTSGSYQQVAAHSLEALSTAATTDHPGYGNFLDGIRDAFAVLTGNNRGHPMGGMPTNSGYGPAGAGVGGVGSTHARSPSDANNNINFLLNPSSNHTHANLIDPNLEAALTSTTHHDVEHSGSSALHEKNDGSDLVVVSGVDPDHHQHHHHHHEHLHDHHDDHDDHHQIKMEHPKGGGAGHSPDEQLALLLRGVDSDVTA